MLFLEFAGGAESLNVVGRGRFAKGRFSTAKRDTKRTGQQSFDRATDKKVALPAAKD
jgi:hypothetical protein